MGLEPTLKGVKENVMRSIRSISIFQMNVRFDENEEVGLAHLPDTVSTLVKRRWALQPVRRCAAGMCTKAP